MPSPAPLARLEELDSTAETGAQTPQARAQIDAAHGTTGWSAYDVWRNRVFAPQTKGYNKPHEHS